MIYGTHNSATGGKLVWWQRPLGWLINLTSKCQNRTIEEQLDDGVRLFNLQVTLYNGVWHFSHGLAIYEEELIPTLALMRWFATQEKPIYIQLYLDDNFITGQKEEEFCDLIRELQNNFKGKPMHLTTVWIEGSEAYFSLEIDFKVPYIEERYWTLSWAKKNAENWIDHLPLPKRHAKKYNAEYKRNGKGEFLMLDFYEI